MKQDKQQYIDQLSDYLKGELGQSEQEKFEQGIAGSEFGKDFKDLKKVWAELQAMQEQEPSEGVSTRFYAMLEAYKAGQNAAKPEVSLRNVLNKWLNQFWPQQPVIQFGLALALLVVGIFFGGQFKNGANQDMQRLNSEVVGLKQMVAISLLQNQSPVERLRGIGYSHNFDDPNPDVLSALLTTLNFDPNVNVRLAAAEALTPFYGIDTVRSGVLHSLKQQKSPLLQIALINVLLAQNEKESIETLEYLQNNDDYDKAVRSHAGQAIERLK